ncbi:MULTISPECIES: hypothetical protein [Paenibacillus]|uniref:Uncharacterized protein n=1 Tax=Paenibacillus pabuli TaxID=1472 RepID=A0A855YEU5_9BACL|nr:MULTISPECIES: hypothetical protein [Paenibacillus]PWW43816.1 hypothetical protein DET56_10242 [Paenibacillus pabuli]PXW09845.1 hypothetical protein DEU73_10242 [Paenibacillus taichungensis]
MAGTRGLARFRGEQFNNNILRNNHFDASNKINESYISIDFKSHREILEDTKIDVFVQVNDVDVEGVSEIDISRDVGARPVATALNVEGVVLTEKVQVRLTGTDSPIGDADSDVVYGRLEENTGVYTLKFYSLVGGTEQPFTFDANAVNVDYRFAVRTNLSIVPVDAIIKGGSGFVEGATDAKAYMNLIQLMKDVYGGSGTLDNDGNANLATSIQGQITKEIQDRKGADDKTINDLKSTAGAGMVGVASDPNYTGLTVQTVLTNLAAKISQANSTNGDRMDGIEQKNTEQDSRLTKLETQDEEEVFEAVGGETQYLLTKGQAKDKTMRLAINGQVQTPGINFEYIKNASSEITGFNFAPDTLKIVDGVPDVVFVQYKKIL